VPIYFFPSLVDFLIAEILVHHPLPGLMRISISPLFLPFLQILELNNNTCLHCRGNAFWLRGWLLFLLQWDIFFVRGIFIFLSDCVNVGPLDLLLFCKLALFVNWLQNFITRRTRVVWVARYAIRWMFHFLFFLFKRVLIFICNYAPFSFVALGAGSITPTLSENRESLNIVVFLRGWATEFFVVASSSFFLV
jgi:hypothetical protein